MAANAEDPAGAASPTEALGQHVDDAADGEKIVHHVFGDNEGAVVNQLGGGLVAKVLPLLAPVVMGFLAKSVLGKGGGGGDAARARPGGLGDVLGGLLGAGKGGGLGGLGDVLGGLLGAGRK